MVVVVDPVYLVQHLVVEEEGEQVVAAAFVAVADLMIWLSQKLNTYTVLIGGKTCCLFRTLLLLHASRIICFYINLCQKILHEYKNVIHKWHKGHKSALSFAF